MQKQSSRFDRLVARYYSAVYGLASRLTDDPRQALNLTRNAFKICEKQMQNLRSQSAIATALLSAVMHAGLAAAA